MMTTWKLTCLVIVYGVLVSQMRLFLRSFWRSSPRWLAVTPRPWLCALCCFTGGDDASPAAAVGPQVIDPVAAAPEPGVHDERQLPPADDPAPPASGRPQLGSGSPRATAFIVRTPRPLLAWGGRFLVWAKLLPREFLQDFTTPETCFWLA